MTLPRHPSHLGLILESALLVPPVTSRTALSRWLAQYWGTAVFAVGNATGDVAFTRGVSAYSPMSAICGARP
jgi:hypothetical protein